MPALKWLTWAFLLDSREGSKAQMPHGHRTFWESTREGGAQARCATLPQHGAHRWSLRHPVGSQAPPLLDEPPASASRKLFIRREALRVRTGAPPQAGLPPEHPAPRDTRRHRWRPTQTRYAGRGGSPPDAWFDAHGLRVCFECRKISPQGACSPGPRCSTSVLVALAMGNTATRHRRTRHWPDPSRRAWTSYTYWGLGSPRCAGSPSRPSPRASGH